MPWRLTSVPPPTAFGAECRVCHVPIDGRDRRCFDADIEVEFEGTYVICDLCIAEGARMLGMFDETAADELLTRALGAEQRAADAEAQLADARVLVDVLRRYDAASPAPVADPGLVSSPTSPADRADSVAAVVESELANPVLPSGCPAAEAGAVDCVRRFAGPAAAGAHAWRAHQWRAA